MADKDSNPELSKKVRRMMREKRKKERYGDPNEDPLVSKSKAFGRNKRYERQVKAAKDLGYDLKEEANRTGRQIVAGKPSKKFLNSQRVNRRAMQQAESQKLQRAARKKQKASDTNQRYGQLAGDMIGSVVSPRKAGKNIKSSAQMATDKAKAVLKRMQAKRNK
jgi:hypothetical protein